MTLGKKPLTTKPGEFYGRCNLPRGRSAADGRCGGFETTDKAAWEAHLKTEHPKRRWDEFRLESARPISSRALPVPRLKPEGQPFVSRDRVTGECRACGEIVEHGLIERHKAECPDRERGAA